MTSYTAEDFVFEFRDDGSIETLVDALLHCENGLEASLLALKVFMRLSEQERRILLSWLEREAR